MFKATARVGMRMCEYRRWRITATLPVMALLGLTPARPAQADTFSCTAEDVPCLIDAINQANANGQTNTIRLEAGTYTLTAVDNDTNGPNGLPSITSTLRIRGAGADATIITRASSAPGFRLLHVGPGGNLTVHGVTLTGGSVSSGGGGLFNRGGVVTLRQSMVSGNSAGTGGGGGLFSDQGVVNITSSTFANNRFNAGGVAASGAGTRVRITHSRFTGNGGGLDAGGIEIDEGTLFVAHSTFDHNSADGAGAIGAGFQAGHQVTLVITDSAFLDQNATSAAIVIGPGAATLVTNTTFARNSVGGFLGGNGEAIDNGSGTLILINGTLADNNSGTPLSHRSALSTGMNARTILVNTLLASNTGPFNQDCQGPTTSIGNNLIGDPAGCAVTLLPSDLTGDPGLDTFTDDGTPGNGHYPLLPSSQAIGEGNDAFCPRTDQIGQPRLSGCDIGAIAFTNQFSDQGEGVRTNLFEQNVAVAAQPVASNVVANLVQAVSLLKSMPEANDDILTQIKAMMDSATLLR